LTIDVTGTNDAPVITSSVENSSGAVTEDVTLKAVGQLTASDVDHNATQAWSIVGSNTGAYGSLAVDASTGQWTYTLANGTNGVAGPVQSLAAGEHYDETFTVRVVDDHGVSAEQVVTVTVHGTNDAPVVTVTNPAAVIEGDIATHSPVTVTIADHVAIADVDASDAHVPYVAGTLVFGSPTGPEPHSGTLSDLFTIDATHGTVTYDRAAFDYLAAGQQVTATFTFDISSGPDTLRQSISVTIDGVNDAPVIDTDSLHISTSHGHTTISGLSISDPDSDHFTIDTTTNHGHVSLADETYDLAAINSALQSGVNYTPHGHSSVGKVALTVTDDHNATDTVNFIFRQNDFGPVTLTGTAQNDVLIGGAGRDYFVFSSNSGHDVITNFTGHDKIVLDGITGVPSGNGFNEWLANSAVVQGADILIHLDGPDNNILLKNVSLANLHANDFIIPHV
jgi:VCBS repeat-containing protein